MKYAHTAPLRYTSHLSTRSATLLAVWLAASLVALLSSGMAKAAPNVVKGAEIFKQCLVCHKVGDGAENIVGPNLNHVFGRKAGTVEGFGYSEPMRAKGEAEGLVWSEKSMYIFLAGPERYVPGTIMGFKGLRKEKEIRDLMAWLLQYSPAYVPESGEEVDPAVASTKTLPPPVSDTEEVEVPDLTEEFLAQTGAIQTGGELWAKQCRHCHGNSAYPGKAPKLKPAGYTPDFVFSRITDGFRKMPAWKTVFTLEERKSLVAYVLSSKFSP